MAKDKDNKQKKMPPSKAIKSIQYDLFSQFLTNDPDSVSNTVELWESIPQVFFYTCTGGEVTHTNWTRRPL